MNSRKSKGAEGNARGASDHGAATASVSSGGALTIRDLIAYPAGSGPRKVGTARLRADFSGEVLLEDLGLRLELRAPPAPSRPAPDDDDDLEEAAAAIDGYAARDAFTR